MQRKCSKCGTSFPLDKEHFRADVRYTGGFKQQCIGCTYTPEYGRKKQMERRYKMTVEQYDSQLAEQGGHCALCSATQFIHKRRLTVDHDHACCSKEVACGKCNRGILCADCNRRVGFLEELLADAEVVPNSGTWTERAMSYLGHWRITHAQIRCQEAERAFKSTLETSRGLIEATLAFTGNLRLINIQVPPGDGWMPESRYTDRNDF